MILEMGTRPAGLEVKTSGFGRMSDTVFLGDYEISLPDFLVIAEYVLTNTDLKPNDLRLQFVRCIQSMREVDGYNPNQKRLESSVPAVLLNKPQ